MNVNYINPFLQGIENIVTQVLGNKPDFAKPFLKEPPFNTDDLLVIISLTGEMYGKVLINIDKSSCKNIASLMMGGMEVEYNEITKSAVGELCNMILGASATVFSNSGVKINISSPTIIDGKSITVSDKDQVLCIPVSVTDKTNFHVNISTKKIA